MNHKILIITFILLGLIASFIVVDYQKKNAKKGQTISNNILFLTQPITSFSGVVEKIEGNRITVSQKQTPTHAVVPPAAVIISIMPSPLPTPKIVTITYQAVVSEKTQIVQSLPVISYLFKAVSPISPEKLTIKDIQVGQNISLATQADLRTLEGTVFEATTIDLPQNKNMIEGKIIRIEGTTLIIKAYPLPDMTPVAGKPSTPFKEKEYTVSLTEDTEISSLTYTTNSPKSEKLGFSDLKIGTQVKVYTGVDIDKNTRVTALRIEPLFPIATSLTTPLAPRELSD